MSNPTVFILTHGRPNTQLTLKMLREYEYSGKIFLVLDDTDKTIQQYIDNYGAENLIIFNKNHYINSVETVTNSPKYACILYAKAAVEDIAQSMGLKSFIIADDDLTGIRFRYENEGKLASKKIGKNFNKVIAYLNEMMLSTNITALSPLYTSFFIGGVGALNPSHIESARFTYIFVLRNASHKVEWLADYGEDNITSFEQNKQGYLQLGIPYLQEDSVSPTVRLEGGMSETYATDTFALCMRCIVVEPAYISTQWYNGKYVPKIQRKNSLPKIISGRYKK